MEELEGKISRGADYEVMVRPSRQDVAPYTKWGSGTCRQKKLNFEEKKMPFTGAGPLQFFGLRTLASLVSVSGISRKIFCQHFVCIPQNGIEWV